MRVLLAPDKFAGTLTATEAITAIRLGWQQVRPADTFDIAPLSDGGPGFIDAVASPASTAADPSPTVSRIDVPGPLGSVTTARILRSGCEAWIESADACGLDLLGPTHRDPMRATSAGVGALIRAAVHLGARRITVGLGGSATCDGGAGALAALGARSRDHRGADASDALLGGGEVLPRIADVDLRAVADLLTGVDLVAAYDVGAVLLGPSGAAYGYAPQKGASAEQVQHLEAALEHWAGLLSPNVPRADPLAPGAGAAGGLGFGLLAAGAAARSGFALIADHLDLARRCTEADVIITGEGRLDWQSGRGKVVGELASLATRSGTPLMVVAGMSTLTRAEWRDMGLAQVATLAQAAGDESAARTDPQRWATQAAHLLARQMAAQA